MRATVRGAPRRERGATIVEYTLVAALVAIVVIGAFTLIGNNINANITTVGSTIGT